MPECADNDFAWTLHVVHHDAHPLRPTRCTLTRGEHASLQRADGDFGALPEDARLSRRHARFAVDNLGALYVTDEGSRNGVHLRGERVQHAPLAPGDVLRVGGFLIVAQPTPARFDDPDASELPAVSALTTRLVRALRSHALEGRRAIVLVGEEGCPGRAAAEVYAQACGVPLSSDGRDGAALWLSRAHLATHGRLTHALASGACVVFDATGAARGWTPPAELAALPVEAIAPLRARREDVPVAIAARWRASSAPWRARSCAQMQALIAAPWPGNDAQLAQVVDALVAGESDAVFGALSLTAPPALDDRVAVARDGSGFRTAEGEDVDLRPRPVLARVLKALCGTGASRSVDDITAAAWPGVQLVGESGAARVYSAVATLRRLGLRDALIRDGDGYALDPRHVRVE